MSDQNPDKRITERELVTQFHAVLDGLSERCTWRAEVWMLCWTHALRGHADRLRIDIVAELDGRLVGFEVKAPATQAVELGRDLLQCAQYAVGTIAPNRADVPRRWIGQSLTAVFLRTTVNRRDDFMAAHYRCAPRIYGPANVGFAVRESWGLCLRLSGERFWTERSGYHKGMLTKLARVGAGTYERLT